MNIQPGCQFFIVSVLKTFPDGSIEYVLKILYYEFVEEKLRDTIDPFNILATVKMPIYEGDEYVETQFDLQPFIIENKSDLFNKKPEELSSDKFNEICKHIEKNFKLNISLNFKV